MIILLPSVIAIIGGFIFVARFGWDGRKHEKPDAAPQEPSVGHYEGDTFVPHYPQEDRDE